MNRRETLEAGLAVLAAATITDEAQAAAAAAAAKPPAVMPGLSLVFTAHVQLGPVQEFGAMNGLRKRVVPIIGGMVDGPRLQGEVLSGGADWQTIAADGFTKISARYTLKAKDGTLIDVINPGIRRGPAEVMQRLAAGEVVDPNLYYFRTVPTFEVATGPYSWLMESIFLCVGKRFPNDVEIDFYAVS